MGKTLLFFAVTSAVLCAEALSLSFSKVKYTFTVIFADNLLFR